jgi:hypothetical protein
MVLVYDASAGDAVASEVSSEARLAGAKPSSCANLHFRAFYELRIGQHY